MSWLQTQTVHTFQLLNPGWEIRIYVPTGRSTVVQNYIPDYLGFDHFPSLRNKEGVQVIDVDFHQFGIGPEIPDILRSDILRYSLLLEHGGVWSDFDVLWLHPMAEHGRARTVGKPVKEPGATVCFSEGTHGWHNIGILTAKPGHPLYEELVATCREKIANITKVKSLSHQEFGVSMLNAMYPTLHALQRKYPDVAGVTYETYYPYGVEELKRLWRTTDLSSLGEHVMAIHWFNGHPLSKAFLNGSAVQDCTMTEVLRRYVTKPSARTHATESTEKAVQPPQPTVWKHEPHNFFEEVKKFILPTSTVLDLGCGLRPMTFFKPTVHVLVEPLGTYVEMLQHRYSGCQGVLVLQKDVLSFLRSLPDAAFDSIFLHDVLNHLSKEDGATLMGDLSRVARVQVVLFTPFGQQQNLSTEEDLDTWGLPSADVRQRSEWLPEDFPSDWRIHVCENCHGFNWKGEPTPPIKALFAIYTRKDQDQPKCSLSSEQLGALRFLPSLPVDLQDSESEELSEKVAVKTQVERLSKSLQSRFKRLEKHLSQVMKNTDRLQQEAKEQRRRPRGLRRLRQTISRLFNGDSSK